MIETTKTTGTSSKAIHAGQNERPDYDAPEQRAHAEYYRAYYRLLVEEYAGRSEGLRGLHAIKRQRRRARREKWLQSIKSLANALSHHGAEAVN